MVKYRNVETGRVIERPAEDEWLEASVGWTRVEDDEPAAEPVNDEDEGSKD